MRRSWSKHAKEWVQNKGVRGHQKGASLNTYPKQAWHEFFNAKQSSSMQKGPQNPLIWQPKWLKHTSMHNAHFKAQNYNTSRHKRMINAVIQAWYRDWNSMRGDSKSFKQPNQSMLMTHLLKAKVLECKGAMQNTMNMTKTVANRPKAWQIMTKSFNMLSQIMKIY